MRERGQMSLILELLRVRLSRANDPVRFPARRVLLLGLLIYWPCWLSGQAVRGGPEFEVASVRRASAVERGSKGAAEQNPALVRFSNFTLRRLIQKAYGIESYRLFGPAWLETEKYDVAAKPPTGSSDEQVSQMLRNLLADRFKLSLHWEKRELTVYVLVVAKNGPKLHEAKEYSPPQIIMPPGRKKMTGSIPISELAAWLRLAGPFDLPVINETGLEGLFEVKLDWTPDDQSSSYGSSAPSIFNALQEQLGLKLEARKKPTDVLVIDHAEKVPTAN
jgi:uncharacterized protein (TIGR03435 family)